MKPADLASLGVKFLGTLALAVGFIFLVAQSPFLAQSPGQARERAEQGDGGPLLAFPNRSGALEIPGSVAPLSVTPQDTLTSSLGLFRGEFGGGPSPGFTTAEHRVPGSCAGAGRRLAKEQCPACEIRTTPEIAGEQQMLIWSPQPGDSAVVSAPLNCTAFDQDGTPLVTVIAFGDGAVNLAGSGDVIARDRVPLVAGANRLAAFELGGWLAVLDEVRSPQQALGDMQQSLIGQGWRKASGSEVPDLPGAEDQLVFTNAANELCVVTLSIEESANQLLTIISSET